MNFSKKNREKTSVTNVVPNQGMNAWRRYNLARQRMRRIVKTIVFLVVLVVGGYFGYRYFDKYYYRPVDIDERIDKNSIHYVTDLYYSDGRYYDEYLNDNEKRLYLHLLKDIVDTKTETKVDCVDYGYSTYSECSTVIVRISKVILLEHPDLFWYDYSSYDARVDKSYIKIGHYYTTRNKVNIYFLKNRLLRRLDEITSNMAELSDYEKVKSVYDWFGSNVGSSTFDTREANSAWNALLKRDSMSKGFALASQLLFQRLGLESTIVYGTKGALEHYWNFVKIDDGYYWFDASSGTKSRKDNPDFYSGFLFPDTKDYGASILNLNNYPFGEKYSNKYKELTKDLK